jgi:hypothetical protein
VTHCVDFFENHLSMRYEKPKGFVHRSQKPSRHGRIQPCSAVIGDPTFLNRDQIDRRPEMFVGKTQMSLFLGKCQHRPLFPAPDIGCFLATGDWRERDKVS